MGRVVTRKEVNILDVSGQDLFGMFGEEITIGMDGKIHIDFGRERDCDSDFVAMTDSHLSCDGTDLVLTKVYTKFSVYKNRKGFVVDIEPGEQTEQEERVPLASCYGHVEFTRSGKTSVSPDFYKK